MSRNKFFGTASLFNLSLICRWASEQIPSIDFQFTPRYEFDFNIINSSCYLKGHG